ncbi:MAG TPA: hypothetical protein VKV37_20795 [Ktedonobacteraceae bacterium]|nr:hypothetical protein [Ktedonobacteraceae bacterium]
MYILLLNGMLDVGDEPLQDQPYNILRAKTVNNFDILMCNPQDVCGLAGGEVSIRLRIPQLLYNRPALPSLREYLTFRAFRVFVRLRRARNVYSVVWKNALRAFFHTTLYT